MVARANPRRQFENSKDGAVVEGRPGLAQAGVFLPAVVDRKTLGRPHNAGGGARAGRDEVLGDFVDLDGGTPGCVVAGNHPADLMSHQGPPRLRSLGSARSFPKPVEICNNPGPCSCASARSSISPKPSTATSWSIRAAATCRALSRVRISSCGPAGSCGAIRYGTTRRSVDAIALRCYAR